MKKLVLLLLVICLPVALFAEKEVVDKDILIQAAIGSGTIDYGDFDPDIYSDNYLIYTQLKGGYSFFPNSYFTVGYSYMHNSIYANTIEENDSTYFLDEKYVNLGYMHYPANTGFFWGVNAGSYEASIEYLHYPNSFTASDTGIGYGLDIGYDFDKDNKGISLFMGASYIGGYVDSNMYNSFTFYGGLNIK